jgi:hypothetical protein
VAGLSPEIGRELTARKLLGVEVLLYRREDGIPVALRNRWARRRVVEEAPLPPLGHGLAVEPAPGGTNA